MDSNTHIQPQLEDPPSFLEGSAREEPHGIMGISDYTVYFIMNIPSFTSSEEESGLRALTLLLGLLGWMDPHYGYHGY